MHACSTGIESDESTSAHRGERLAGSDRRHAGHGQGQPGGQFGGGDPPGGGAGGPGGFFSSRPRRQMRLPHVVARSRCDACSFGTPAATGVSRRRQTVGLSRVSRSVARRAAEVHEAVAATSGALATMSSCCLGPRFYLPADVTFDGETFRHVGFRLKGNSSLVNTPRSGSEKLPFRLNIDGLEARFPRSGTRRSLVFPI